MDFYSGNGVNDITIDWLMFNVNFINYFRNKTNI